jgi:hypothetical protein
MASQASNAQMSIDGGEVKWSRIDQRPQSRRAICLVEKTGGIALITLTTSYIVD